QIRAASWSKKVIARVVIERRCESAHLRLVVKYWNSYRARRLLKTHFRGNQGIIQPCPNPRIAEAVLRPQRSPDGLEIIAQWIILQRRVVPNAVVVQICGSVNHTHHGLQVFIEPMAYVPGECAPGAVLRAKATHSRNIGPPQTGFRI